MSALGSLRHNPAYEASVAELEARGLSHRVEYGGAHPKIVFEYRGKELKVTISGTLSDRARGAKNARAFLRRMLRKVDAEMDGTTNTQVHHGGLPVDIALREIDGEPRVKDIELGERLGFQDPRRIRQLIGRHEGNLRDFNILHAVRQADGTPGRPGLTYYLSEEQALYISAVSEAPLAHLVLKMLIKVFVAWRRGHLGVVDAKAIDLSPDTAAMIGGICKVVMRKALADDREAVGLLVAEQIAKLNERIDRIALPPPRDDTADLITAFEVVAGMAQVPEGKRFGGIYGQVSSRLSKYCARHGYRPGIIELRPGEKMAFPRQAVEAWLSESGRREIWSLVNDHAAKKAGQGKLRLVPQGALV